MLLTGNATRPSLMARYKIDTSILHNLVGFAPINHSNYSKFGSTRKSGVKGQVSIPVPGLFASCSLIILVLGQQFNVKLKTNAKTISFMLYYLYVQIFTSD